MAKSCSQLVNLTGPQPLINPLYTVHSILIFQCKKNSKDKVIIELEKGVGKMY